MAQIIGPSLDHRVRSLAAAFTLGAGVALSAMAAAASSATAQELEWAKKADGEGFGIATDSHNDSYVTGFFTGTATFGAGEYLPL
jgi:hypothetical protein